MSALTVRLASKGALDTGTRALLGLFNAEAWVYYHDHEKDDVFRIGIGFLSVHRTLADLHWLFVDLFGPEL